MGRAVALRPRQVAVDAAIGAGRLSSRRRVPTRPLPPTGESRRRGMAIPNGRPKAARSHARSRRAPEGAASAVEGCRRPGRVPRGVPGSVSGATPPAAASVPRNSRLRGDGRPPPVLPRRPLRCPRHSVRSGRIGLSGRIGRSGWIGRSGQIGQSGGSAGRVDRTGAARTALPRLRRFEVLGAEERDSRQRTGCAGVRGPEGVLGRREVRVPRHFAPPPDRSPRRSGSRSGPRNERRSPVPDRAAAPARSRCLHRLRPASGEPPIHRYNARTGRRPALPRPS